MGHIVDNVVDGGSLCFLSVRFKTVTRSVTFLKNHTCCHRGKPRCRKNLKLMPSWKTTPAAFRNWFCDAKEVPVCGTYWCICRRCWVRVSSFSGILHANRKLRYLLPRKNVKISTFVLQLRKVPPGKHSVAVKQFKRERRFRLLGHIPHTLVDDGALFP